MRPWHLRPGHRIGRGDSRTASHRFPALAASLRLSLSSTRGIGELHLTCVQTIISACFRPAESLWPALAPAIRRQPAVPHYIAVTDRGACNVPACPAYDPSRDKEGVLSAPTLGHPGSISSAHWPLCGAAVYRYNCHSGFPANRPSVGFLPQPPSTNLPAVLVLTAAPPRHRHEHHGP